MNLTKYEQFENMHHASRLFPSNEDILISPVHCLEGIRRGVLCRGDISPVTYRFKPDWRIPVANWTSPHECKDWNSLLDWAKENSVNPMKPGLVVHPTLGMYWVAQYCWRSNLLLTRACIRRQFKSSQAWN